jgi:hypothetical protein
MRQPSRRHVLECRQLDTGSRELDLDDDRSLDGASGTGHCEVRRVSNAGSFRFAAVPVFLSQALNGEYIALEGSDDGLWNILFYSTLLGRFDQASGKISVTDDPGCSLRAADAWW